MSSKNLISIGIRIRSMRDSNLVFFETFSEHTRNEIWIHFFKGFESTLLDSCSSAFWNKDSNPTFRFCIFPFYLFGFISFALGLNTFLKTLNSLISKHIKSVLVSSKSIRDQPWFNNLPFFDDDKTLNQKNRFWFLKN